MAGLDRLVGEARVALRRAYSPYSGIKVGAAVLFGDKIYSGCNIENASYGLAVCAERVAILKAVSENRRRLRGVAVASDAKNTLLPCGACLQVISEFASGDWIPILVAKPNDKTVKYTLRDLLPSGSKVKRAVAKSKSE